MKLLCSNIFCAGQELLDFEEELHEFQEHYSEVVRNQASVTLKITKCTTIGPPRIGKTCLKHYLTGQEWDLVAGTASTDVMEAPEWVECYSLEEGGADKPWKLLSAEQQQGELIRAVNALMTSSCTGLTTTPKDASSTATPSDVQHPTTPSDGLPTITPSDAPPTATSSDAQHPTTPSDAPPTATSSDAQHPTTPSDAPPTATSSDAQHPTTPSDVPPTTTPTDTHFRTTPSSAPPPSTKPEAAQKPATVRQALEALAGTCSREALQEFLKDKEGRVLGETHLVHFIDTGGQAIYHDIHPVLITSPSVYLVVFSLEDFYRTGDKEKLDYFRSDLIQRPLRSIYTFGMKTPQDKAHLELHPETPKILIVGTHLDQIPLGNSDMEGFLDAVSKMIEQEIDNKPYRKFVQYDTKDHSFWAVDNTQAGKKQDGDAKKYSTALRMMVLEGSTEMSVKVPVSWLLLQLVMEGQGVRYCTYSELLQEARIRGYVSEQSATTDLDTMLRLFHILGLFYHKVPKGYKKEDSLVFINPDCLYSATSDFLMAVKEEVEDNQGGSEEGQHQTQADNMEETKESQGSSEEGQRPNKAATKEETEDSQGGSEEGQHPTKAATKEETEDSQGGSEEGQHQTKAANMEETEDSQGGSEEGQHQTQAGNKEETEDSQGGSEEGQHPTKAGTKEKTEDSQGGSEEGQHPNEAATTKEGTEDTQGGSDEAQRLTKAATTIEETGDIQGGSEEGQHPTEAATKEKTEDSQGGSEEGQHPTKAGTKEEAEDSQGGSEEGQHPTKAATTKKGTEDTQGGSEEAQRLTEAATKEKTEDIQVGSEEGQHQTKAATKEENEDSQGGSEEGQHPTKAATKEETEDSQEGSEKGQHPTKAATTKEETKDTQGGIEEDQHPTKAATMEECYDETVTGNESKQQKQEPKGIVQKIMVIERIQRNSGHIQHEMEAVLQKVEKAMTLEAIEAVLESLHDQLMEKIEQRYKLHPGECQDASSVKAKRQLFIGTLVHSLASSVKAVLHDLERKGDVDHVRKEVAKAVKNVRAHYQSRSINSRDMDQFFAILSDLRIVAQLGDSDGYVVPAALPKRKVPHTVEIAGQFEADPILVTVVSQTTMQVCYLPSGLFCCLISELVTKADWTVHPHGRTHVTFTHKDLSGRVHITECKSYIKINMESHASLQEPSEAFQFQNVRERIHNSIVHVYENLYSDPTAVTTFEESLQWGFQCEEHPDDDTHIAAYEEDEYECCAKCLIQSHVIQAVKPEQLVWFGSE